jgi:hypothetical protein
MSQDSDVHQYIANVGGLTIVENRDMLKTGWLLKDENGKVLRVGLMTVGEYRTPGTDQTKATTLECGSEVYRAIRKAQRNG